MTANEFEELFDVLMAEEIFNLKEKLEEQYIQQSIMFMNPTDWDDIVKYNKTWQQRMRDIINETN